jgi:hypothetical protein
MCIELDLNTYRISDEQLTTIQPNIKTTYFKWMAKVFFNDIQSTITKEDLAVVSNDLLKNLLLKLGKRYNIPFQTNLHEERQSISICRYPYRF